MLCRVLAGGHERAEADACPVPVFRLHKCCRASLQSAGRDEACGLSSVLAPQVCRPAVPAHTWRPDLFSPTHLSGLFFGSGCVMH